MPRILSSCDSILQHMHTETSYALFRVLVKTPYFGLCLLVFCISSKQKDESMWSMSFLKYSFEKHIKKRETWQKNYNYVLYMKIKFSLFLLSVTESHIRYKYILMIYECFIKKCLSLIYRSFI